MVDSGDKSSYARIPIYLFKHSDWISKTNFSAHLSVTVLHDRLSWSPQLNQQTCKLWVYKIYHFLKSVAKCKFSQ